MKGSPARPRLLNIPTARHFENWLSINMVADRRSQGPSLHNGASAAAAIQPAQTPIIIDDKYLSGSSIVWRQSSQGVCRHQKNK